MPRHSELTLLAHLSDADSLDALARDGFLTEEVREAIPTEFVRVITGWALERFFADGRVIAPSRQALCETWADTLERYEVELPPEEQEIDSIGYVITDLRANHARIQAEKLTTQFAQEMGVAEGPDRLRLFVEYSDKFFTVSQSLVSKVNEADGFLGLHAATARLAERIATGDTDFGMHLGMDLIDAHLHGIRPGEICILCSPPGSGKAAWVDTPIATPSGWSTMGQLAVGDHVYDEQGKVCQVTWKSPIWWQQTYRVSFTDGASVIVNGAHEWNVLDRRSRRNQYKKYQKVRDWRENWHRTRTYSTDQLIEQGLLCSDGSRRWSIPCAQPLEGSGQLPIHPYVLGIWLADGFGREGAVSLNSTTKREIPGYLRSLGEDVRSRPSDPTVWSIRGLSTRLRKLGLQNNKHIPMSYLRAAEVDRLELLRGIMDGDGFLNASGCGVGIDLMSEQLASDVVQLVRSLGWRTSCTVGRAVVSERGIRREVGQRWRMNWRPDKTVFRCRNQQWAATDNQASRYTARVIEAIEKVPLVPTVCIEVDSPSHLYLLGSELIPTHNSWSAGLACYREWRRGRKVAFITLENNVEVTYDRLACMATGIPYEDFQAGRVADEQLKMIFMLLDEMEVSDVRPMIIQLDPSQRTASGVIRKALLEDADSLIVDQLSFLRTEKGSKTTGRNFQVAEIMHTLKEMVDGSIRKIPLMLLVQINREGAKAARKEGRFRMEHLAESAAVEQYADFIWAIYQSNAMFAEGVVQLQCLKSRRTPIAHFEFLWRPAIGLVRGTQQVELDS